MCTWDQCPKLAEHPQLSRNGEEWANLCDEHHRQLEEALGTLDARRTLGAWAKAGTHHPGRTLMIESMAEGVVRISRGLKGRSTR